MLLSVNFELACDDPRLVLVLVLENEHEHEDDWLRVRRVRSDARQVAQTACLTGHRLVSGFSKPNRARAHRIPGGSKVSLPGAIVRNFASPRHAGEIRIRRDSQYRPLSVREERLGPSIERLSFAKPDRRGTGGKRSQSTSWSWRCKGSAWLHKA